MYDVADLVVVEAEQDAHDVLELVLPRPLHEHGPVELAASAQGCDGVDDAHVLAPELDQEARVGRV